MGIQVNSPGAETSGLQNILGIFGKIGGASQAYNTVKGWASGSNAMSTGTPTAYAGPDMPTVGGYSEGGAAGAGADAAGGADAAVALAYRGGIVPGRDRVSGDSPKNDIVNRRVSPGELIVPRSDVDKGAHAVQEFAMNAIKRRLGRK